MTNETQPASTAQSQTLQAPKQRIVLAKTKKAKMIALLSRKSGADVPWPQRNPQLAATHDAGGAVGPA